MVAMPNRACAAASLLAAVLCLPGRSAGAPEKEPPAAASERIERLINRGAMEEALAAVDRLLAGQGETARGLFYKGAILYRQSRHREALQHLQKSFSLDENAPDTSKALGLCLVKLGKPDLAETFFAIAVRLAPGDFMARYYLGLRYYISRRFDLAASEFRKAVEIEPDYLDGHAFLGRAQEALGDYEGAARHYGKANELNRESSPGSFLPPLLLGSFLFRQGRMDEAESLLLESIRYDAGNADARYELGLLLERRYAFPRAVEQLQRAASLAPADHRPHYALSRIYRRLGDARKARDAVNRFRERRVRSVTEMR